MTYTTTSDFRMNMAEYLDKVKMGAVLFLWRRKKKEFVILPSSMIDEEDLEILKSKRLKELIEERKQQKTFSLEEVENLLGV